MTNDYFNHGSALTQHTLARASQVNAIFQSIVAGLDKLPNADPLNQGRVTYVADTGAANAYVVALAKAPSAYTAGLSIVMKAANTNTGASTVNVNSLGVKTIKRYNGDDLVANDIVAGALIHLVYDGTNFRVVGANGAESALAKKWATSTTVVSGGLKGARGYAQDASSSATAAATSEANAEAQFNAFQGVFYGSLSSDPATDPNGDPPDEGDWYYNTVQKIPRIFDGSVFKDIGSARLTTFVFTATGGETSLSGDDDNGNTLSYTVDFIQVHKNGALLVPDDDYTADDGTSITGLSAATAGDVYVIDAFATLSLSNVLTEDDLSDNEILGKKGAADPTGLTPKEVFALLVHSAAGTNVYSADLVGDVTAGERVLVDIANANDAVAPIFENTNGSPADARRVRITENDDNWVQVGNDLNVTAFAGISGLSALNITDVAFIDGDNDQLRTYRFNGKDWAQVGNSLSIAGSGLPTLAALNETDVAYIDGALTELRAYRFDGTDWAQVGNSLSVLGGAPELAALNGTDVAYINASDDELRTYRFDGTDWSQVGNSLSIASVANPALSALNETDVAFIDGGNEQLRTYRFDGTDWAQIGNSLAITDADFPALAALNETDVAFADSNASIEELRTYRFDGTDWTEVGNALAISGISEPILAALNGSDVAYIDSGNEDLRTYTLNVIPKGALSGIHTFELASDGTWLVLDPKRGTSIDPNLGFDTWRTPNANRATRVTVRVALKTDGTTAAQIDFEVDEDGGTTADYNFRSLASQNLPSGTFISEIFSVDIPPGGSYRIANTSDPSAANDISTHREFTI